jgi:hypothetical protein
MIESSHPSRTWACALLAVAIVACGRGEGTAPAVPAQAASAAHASSPGPDLGEILRYARRASAAYEDEAAIRAAIEPGSTLAVSDLPGVDVRVFVETDAAHGVQWVSVRGTANLANVREDAEYAKAEASDLGIPVHRGFVEDARAVWTFARPRVRPGMRTRLTGHSLGGALAVLLAMRLGVDGQPIERVITFGQPKVTTEQGVARFRALPLLRVVNHDDPVPLLPWETPGAAAGGLYRHLGAELRLTDSGTFQLFPEHRAEAFLLSSFVGHLGRENPVEHEMRRYLGRLEALVFPGAPAGGALGR